MQIEKIVFFNHYHNGDCFISKAYILDIIKLHPNISFSYAHKNHHSVIADIEIKNIPLSALPENITHHSIVINNNESSSLYINTWVGAWYGKYLFEEHQRYANFFTQHQIWIEIYKELNIPIQPSYKSYLPETNWHSFDLEKTIQFLNKFKDRDLILVCNGAAKSGQSAATNFEIEINQLAQDFPDKIYILTDYNNIKLDNVLFTDDIFESNIGNLNQISYIGNFSRIIIGKNSGPFSFCHTKDNLNNPKKIFISFSTKIQECLTGYGKYLANTFQSNASTPQETYNILHYIMRFEYYSDDTKTIKQLT